MTTYKDRAARELGIVCHHAQEVYLLAVIRLGIFHQIAVPQRIVAILDGDDRRIDVKGKGILDLIHFHLAVREFIKDVGAAGNGAHQLMQFHAVGRVGTAVEYHGVRIGQLVRHKIPHVCVVCHDVLRIVQGDLLTDEPFVRHGVIHVAQKPHAVAFDDHAFALVRIAKCVELVGVELCFGIKRNRKHVLAGETGGIVLFLAFLAQEQKGLFACVEAAVL